MPESRSRSDVGFRAGTGFFGLILIATVCAIGVVLTMQSATGPYEDWHRQAWAGALVLVSMVLGCSLLARFATRRLERMLAR